MLFWTAGAAIGGVGAAVAAVYAARIALRVAEEQMKYQRSKGLARSVNIGTLIKADMQGARGTISLLETVLPAITDAMATSDVMRLLGTVASPKMEYAEKYAVDLDEIEGGHRVARAVAAARELSSALNGIRDLASIPALIEDEIVRPGALRMLSHSVEVAKAAVNEALNVLPR